MKKSYSPHILTHDSGLQKGSSMGEYISENQSPSVRPPSLSLSPNPIQAKTADPNKSWSPDSFFKEYTNNPSNKELTPQEVKYFEDYERRANIYLNRPNRQWTGVTKLTGKMYADAAKQTYLKYNKDITKVVPLEFALSQGQFESHFGLKSRNAELNPYNVGEYDSGTAPWSKKISTSAMGIAMYYDLMAEDYLSRKTPDQMLEPGGFVNENGDRYASNVDYESVMKKQIAVTSKYINDTDKTKSTGEIKPPTITKETVKPQEQPNQEIESIADRIYKAIDGWGTDENAVYSALSELNHNQEKIDALKTIYQKKYGTSLETAIRGDFSNSYVFGNELNKALSYLNILQEDSKNDSNKDEPKDVVNEREEDKAMRPDISNNAKSKAANRWIDDGKATSYSKDFNEKIEEQIVSFFGKGYTRDKVLEEIKTARKNKDYNKAHELEIKLHHANLYAVVETLDVEDNALYQRTSTATFCNIYAYDVVTAMGGYLPRVWWYEKYEKKMIEAIEKREKYEEKVVYGETVHEMNANALTKWMYNIGQNYYGWEQAADMESAQKAANEGNLVIILAANKNPKKSGHVNVILPETEQLKAKEEDGIFKPIQSQAGASNYKYKTLGAWWNNSSHQDGAAWIAKGKLDSPLLSPEQLGGSLEGKVPDTADNQSTNKEVEKPKSKTGTITSEELNVRKGPGKEFDIVEVKKKGSKLTIYETKGDWYRIGVNTWVSSKFVTVQ